ncbi:GNAT family N-acetyltransferase [Streptococcus marmotae]|uniref:GNAT family N-acetyltransferase n=1 Tax=Streptococcus marmotae TaxID=1825069 RepID=UPI0008340C26|nr:GNAT family N-acetyltransferase [Streptococcus marmotae]
MITFKTIDEENFQACIDLTGGVEKEQNDFVDSVLYSLAEAWVYRDSMEAFAIYQEEQIIGFVSMYVGEENPQIINFLIDIAFQGRGYGTQAASRCTEYLQEMYRAKRISLPVRIQNEEAQRFWAKQGFSFSDTVE